MKKIYLFLAVLGTIVPYYFFIQHFQTTGIGFQDFIQALFINGAAGGVSSDVIISSGTFWLFIALEKRTKKLWLYIFLNLAIGLSCALPLYLYNRESK